MQGADVTQFTLGFFIIQALTVFMVAWVFVFFLLRSRRRRTEVLRLFKKLVANCSADPELDALVNDYTEKALKYMEFLVSPTGGGSEPEELTASLAALEAYIKSRDYTPFINPSLADKGKLYKSALLMKQIYHTKAG
ncbi:hypothetical protein EP073_12425 [Geovibrio thiophilus]|uniref:Uncharacterized protein n=1 Tax=Geovibrio thiophilus TaxID=139438 RepID=A0A3R5V2T2_9BACT|nr:hypothetical protein [Geovibrio thiophilus]QAR34180.1 hypothetical protein EP073_12425 [Geovibrio thiophilus]